MFTREGIEEGCAIPLEGNVHKRGDRGGLCHTPGGRVMFTRGGIEEGCAIPLEGNVHKRGDRGGLCHTPGG